MKRLMCLVLLVLILGLNVWSESTTTSLKELRQEINFLQNVMLEIGNELSLIELNSRRHLKLKEEELTELRNSYNGRITYLKKRWERVEEERKELQKECDRLKDSEGLPEILKSKHEEIAEDLQGQIKAWRGIAIGSAVAVVAVVVYIIVRKWLS